MLPLIIIQARLGSSRLPKKVLKTILGKPLIHYTLSRLKDLQNRAKIVIATTNLAIDDEIANYCKEKQVDLFRGSEANVLERYFLCAQNYRAETIIRITGDCPLVDPYLLEKMLDFYLKNLNTYDYVSNVLDRSYPKGLDIEIFNYKTLKKAYFEAQTNYQKEHVTPYIYQNPKLFNLYNFRDTDDHSLINVSVDTQKDFDFVEKLIKKYYPTNPLFGLKEIKEYCRSNNEVQSDATHLSQNV
ncbi:MAG: 8-amino-3,8-dideoxy-manno-octulosonate cytidylyltransferase [Chlamydiae bacterium]|nr:8-amino-3,8-dideoxy-manno-octulosonate cytidylyltransferase [Chlamydiota bacterium]